MFRKNNCLTIYSNEQQIKAKKKLLEHNSRHYRIKQIECVEIKYKRLTICHLKQYIYIDIYDVTIYYKCNLYIYHLKLCFYKVFSNHRK